LNLPDFTATTPLAVALDLDETTLGSDSRLADRTRRALHAVYNAGLPLVIATSRPERVLSMLVGDDIVEITSLVQMNGTIANGRAGLTGSFNTASPTMVVPVEEAIDVGPAKISVNGLGTDLEELANELETQLSNKTVIHRAASAQFLNVVPRAATKSGAIASLLGTADISLADVLAFGDDYVDIDLIRDCGWSVAVDNAVPEIKSLAKYLTASNDDYGVAIVLERLVAAS
jgi:hydroxymethylpyrimidine pyrophosphatase-like HAD family hydrolase